ncbi:unnamed protein product [Phytophthora lilii]|uniref:Unnamed protein product n=1 Tax=Phytophthora lilii TaxID=2077276 RepID=A0A9W6UCI4_9STRA|nr:unnamed protein product [Phytophthora lilii]
MEEEIHLKRNTTFGRDCGVWTREDLVVTAKLLAGSKPMDKATPNSIELSRKHIVEGLKGSLHRMQLDYVDVVFCHRPDALTPIEETVRAMNFVIEQGWAFYWGTSEWLASDIREACEIADRLGLTSGPLLSNLSTTFLSATRWSTSSWICTRSTSLG